MKLAIKVLTEWDRENVIPFFEKHFPNCNKEYKISFKDSFPKGYDIFFINKTGLLDVCDNMYTNLSDYTILQGVPKDMELPKVEQANNLTIEQLDELRYGDTDKLITRVKELEDCVQMGIDSVEKWVKSFSHYMDITDEEFLTQAKQLLKK